MSSVVAEQVDAKGNDIHKPIKGEVKVGECHVRCKSLPAKVTAVQKEEEIW